MKNNKKPGCLIGVFLLILFLLVGVNSVLNKSDSASSYKGSAITSVNNSVKCPSIASETVYSDNGITIITTGFEYNNIYNTYILKCTIYNNSTKNVNYSSSSILVNGYSMDTYAYGDIYAKNNVNVEMAIAVSDISMSKIDKITDIGLVVRFGDNETKDYLFTTDISIKTSDYGTYNQEYILNGKEIYNSNGIKIYAVTNSKDSINEPLTFYVENNTDRTISFLYKDISYNNIMVQHMHSGFAILPNSHKVTKMKILMFSNEHNITSLDSISFTLNIQPLKNNGGLTTAELIETPKISLDF